MLNAKTLGLVMIAVVAAVASLLLPKKQADVAPVGMTILSELFDDQQEKTFSTPQPGSYTLPVIKPAGDGKLLDIHGKTVDLAALTKGNISLVSFVYTSCSVEKGCPLSMSTLFDIFHTSEKVAGLADNAKLITISFDPQRDTPEVMASYGFAALADKNKSEKLPWHFLTAKSQKQLAPVLSAYGQSIARQQSNDTIDHLLRLYLVDRKGQVRNIYGLGYMDPRLLFADIYTLLLEDGTFPSTGSSSGS